MSRWRTTSGGSYRREDPIDPAVLRERELLADIEGLRRAMVELEQSIADVPLRAHRPLAVLALRRCTHPVSGGRLSEAETAEVREEDRALWHAAGVQRAQFAFERAARAATGAAGPALPAACRIAGLALRQAHQRAQADYERWQRERRSRR